MGLVLGFFFSQLPLPFSAECHSHLQLRLLENLQSTRSSAQSPQGGACAGGRGVAALPVYHIKHLY